jgi:hypothetical protein
MNFQLTCSFCDNKQSLTANQLSEVRQDGLIFTVFTCENCGKQRIVQIDSEETLKLLSEYKHIYLRAIQHRKNGKRIPKKLKQKADTYKLQLDSKRKELNVKYASLFTEFVDNKEQSESCEPATI